MARPLADQVQTFRNRGYCPVPWAHHPIEIRDEIRRIRFRPRLKHCFANAQLFVAETTLNVWYVEGWILVLGRKLAHAWVEYQKRVLDLTLAHEPVVYRPYRRARQRDVRVHVTRIGDFGIPMWDKIARIGLAQD